MKDKESRSLQTLESTFTWDQNNSIVLHTELPADVMEMESDVKWTYSDRYNNELNSNFLFCFLVTLVTQEEY